MEDLCTLPNECSADHLRLETVSFRIYLIFGKCFNLSLYHLRNHMVFIFVILVRLVYLFIVCISYLIFHYYLFIFLQVVFKC